MIFMGILGYVLIRLLYAFTDPFMFFLLMFIVIAVQGIKAFLDV